MNSQYTKLLREIKGVFPFSRRISVEIKVSEKDMVEFDRNLREEMIKSGDTIITYSSGISENIRITSYEDPSGRITLLPNGK